MPSMLYVPTMNVTIPDGVEVYYVSAANSTSATLSPVTSVIPANTPVIIKADAAGDKTFTATSTEASSLEDNLLHYSETAFAANGEFVLANDTKGIGFYPATSGEIAARKAYLNSTFDAHFLAFSFDEESTGIGATLNDNGEMTNDKPVYNLAGQRVSKPSKGIYIVGGKLRFASE